MVRKENPKPSPKPTQSGPTLLPLTLSPRPSLRTPTRLPHRPSFSRVAWPALTRLPPGPACQVLLPPPASPARSTETAADLAEITPWARTPKSPGSCLLKHPSHTPGTPIPHPAASPQTLAAASLCSAALTPPRCLSTPTDPCKSTAVHTGSFPSSLPRSPGPTSPESRPNRSTVSCAARPILSPPSTLVPN